MLYKQLIYWQQKWLRPMVVSMLIKVVVTICLTTGMLSIFGSIAPVSNAQTVFLTSIAVDNQLVSKTKQIQNEQTVLKTTPTITVYRSPECNCCGSWIDHLKAQGFETKDVVTPDILAVKQKYNVPDNLTSCHTAIVNGYVLEGHVPANDINHLLQDNPNVVGLSVPGMPVGTPGMEIGNQKDPFTVFSFKQNKVAVFNEYRAS